MFCKKPHMCLKIKTSGNSGERVPFGKTMDSHFLFCVAVFLFSHTQRNTSLNVNWTQILKTIISTEQIYFCFYKRGMSVLMRLPIELFLVPPRAPRLV